MTDAGEVHDYSKLTIIGYDTKRNHDQLLITDHYWRVDTIPLRP